MRKPYNTLYKIIYIVLIWAFPLIGLLTVFVLDTFTIKEELN